MLYIEEMRDLSVDKNIVMRQIGAKLSYWRTLRQMTQAQLSKKSGVSRTVISRIERGVYSEGINLSILMNLAESLQIDFTVLITFDKLERKMWDDKLSYDDDM